MLGPARWPADTAELVAVQVALAEAARAALVAAPWRPSAQLWVGGCFVAPERSPGLTLPEEGGALAAAVVWHAGKGGVVAWRRSDDALRGSQGMPRRARDLEAQVVVRGSLDAPYVPGLLALRHGPILAEAVASLPVRPDVLLVDATGLDHPRRAGLAIQLGAFLELPTVGVTDRALLAHGEAPGPRRGERRPAHLDGEVVAYLVRTRDGARPVLAHSAWRTTPAVAAEVVLRASTGAARTPVPLQEARRVAREARAAAATRR